LKKKIPLKDEEYERSLKGRVYRQSVANFSSVRGFLCVQSGAICPGKGEKNDYMSVTQPQGGKALSKGKGTHLPHIQKKDWGLPKEGDPHPDNDKEERRQALRYSCNL